MTRHELARLAGALTKDGWFVFPIGADKRPACEHGHLDAVCREDKAYRLFMSSSSAHLIGAAMGVMSMHMCLDVDHPVGMGWLAANWGRLGNTLMHRTPRGGVHIFYKLPGPPCPVITSRQVCDRKPLLAHGVDIQAEGRSAILAPSPGYTIINAAPIAELPSWIKHRLLRKPKKFEGELRRPPDTIESLEGVLSCLQHTKQGQRNQILFWAACRAGEVVRAGMMSEADAVALVAQSGVSVGLDRLEAWRSAKSGVQTTARG